MKAEDNDSFNHFPNHMRSTKAISRPSITIVIPCRDDANLARAIRSARHPAVEVLVVLNAPSPPVRTIAKAEADRVIEIAESNLAIARQAGVDAATAKNVMFLDSDCWLAPNSIDNILWGLARHQVVKPRLRYVATTRTERLVARVREYTTVNTELPLLPLALQASLSTRVGGYLFDPRLAWGEDWDLAARIMAAGITVCLLTNATIYHEPLPIWADLASARRIGRGRFLQWRAGLSEGRRLRDDICFVGEARKFQEVRRDHGVVAAAYHLFGWRIAYKWGFHMAGLRWWAP